MKMLRVFLLMFMALVMLSMVCFPGLYDSKRRFSSHRQLYDAQRQHEIASTPETQSAFDMATRALEDAKRLDRRDIMVFEIFMLGVLGVSVYAFLRAGKSVQQKPRNKL
jgi:hypothetical protein